MPVKRQKVGKGGKVIYANALFDFEEVIDAIRYWSQRNGYINFKLKKFSEEILPKGLRFETDISFFKQPDFYTRQEVDINLLVKHANKVEVKSEDGEVKILTQGDIIMTQDTAAIPDYDDVFSDKKGHLWKIAHHFFFEFIYKKQFLDYKFNVGINTGKLHSLVKNKLDYYKKFKPIS